MIFAAVEVSLAGSKPPAAVGERISKCERHDLGPAVPLSTKASSLEQGNRSDAVTTKAGRIHRVGINPVGRKPIPCISWTAVAAPSVRSRVLVSACLSFCMPRRGYRASCSKLVKSWSILLNSSLICFKASSHVFFTTLHSSSHVTVLPSAWGIGPLPSRTASIFFRGMVE